MSHDPASIDLFGVAWRLGATLFFVALNGFFVAAEFALVKVRASRIEALARDRGGSARGVQATLEDLDRYLSACQLGVTLASLALGALGEPAVSVLILAALRALGVEVAPHATWLPIVSIGLAFSVITALHITLGEQAPKMWALRRAEVIALQTSPLLRGFTFVFAPFISAINAFSNWVLRFVGLPPESGHEHSHTADEIRGIALLSARAGHIGEREYELTANVFRMMDLEVRHIIVPRVDLTFLSLDKSQQENLARVRSGKHSRLPLCEVGLDTVLGFVHAKDVLDRVLGGEREIPFRALAREAVFVTDTMAVSDFLLELQQKQEHCAVVVDEHGTAIGLAFREDALAEIVGPLGDEFHQDEPDFRQLEDGAWEILGRAVLPEVCDRLGFELAEGEDESEETLGGHVSARLGRLPRKGDRTRVGPYRATVIEMARRRVSRLRLEPASEDEGGEEGEGREGRERGAERETGDERVAHRGSREPRTSKGST